MEHGSPRSCSARSSEEPRHRGGTCRRQSVRHCKVRDRLTHTAYVAKHGTRRTPAGAFPAAAKTLCSFSRDGNRPRVSGMRGRAYVDDDVDVDDTRIGKRVQCWAHTGPRPARGGGVGGLAGGERVRMWPRMWMPECPFCPLSKRRQDAPTIAPSPRFTLHANPPSSLPTVAAITPMPNPCCPRPHPSRPAPPRRAGVLLR